MTSTKILVDTKSQNVPVRVSQTGKRKESAARVYLKPGSGNIVINGRQFDHYFNRLFHQKLIKKPLIFLDMLDNFDIMVVVKGGGVSGQAAAISHGLSKAIAQMFGIDSDVRKRLRSSGFLTRDSRVVHPKRYGRRKARRAFQFSKR